MKILVTGSEGFVGRHVVKLLLEQGHDVTGVDMMLRQVHDIGLPKAQCRRHMVSVGSHLIDTTYDTVIHLAAHVGVGQSMQHPVDYVDRNTLDTAMMLEGFGKHKPRKLVVASSMSVYGEGPTNTDHALRFKRKPDGKIESDSQHRLISRPVTETHPVNPRSIYALTKYDQEQLCLLWGEAHGMPSVALRFFNIYGPGQALTNPYTGVLSIFATRLLNFKAPVIYEDGQQTRDFVHVSDVARAVVHAATSERVEHGVYNVGTGVPRTIESVARLLAEKMGADLPPVITGEKRAGDIRHCFADIGKLQATGWEPHVTFEEGIAEYVEWLREQPKPVDRFDEAKAELAAEGLVT